MSRRTRLLVCITFVLASALTPALGGSRLHEAREVAQWRWGNVCGGLVDILNRPLDPPMIAEALWNDTPSGPTDCTVVYTTRRHWQWWDLCRATVHEYGHLAGRKHSSDPWNVMFPYTRDPWPPCGPDHNHHRRIP